MEALENVQLALAIIYNEKLACYSPRMVPVASYCFYYIINMAFYFHHHYQQHFWPSKLVYLEMFGYDWHCKIIIIITSTIVKITCIQ
jgi:hypothetical protein